MDSLPQYIVKHLADNMERSNPLFGATQHIVQLTGSGYAFGLFSTYTDAGAVQSAIANALNQAGWGVQTITVTPSWKTYISPTGTNYYDFDIWIDNSTGQSAESIRGNVEAIVNTVLNASVSYVGEQIYNSDPNTGQTVITDQYNNQIPQQQAESLWEQIFGKGKNPTNTLPSLSNATISFGTIALIVGVGYILISSRRK